MNANPRIGVVLALYGASAELRKAMEPWARWGLRRFNATYPVEDAASEDALVNEWRSILSRREQKNQQQEAQ